MSSSVYTTMARRLVIFKRFEMEREYKGVATHRLALDGSTFTKAEANFREVAADPTTVNIAFFLPNEYMKAPLITGFDRRQSLVLIDDVIYMRINDKAVRNTLSTFIDYDDCLIILLRWYSDSQVHNYKANMILREFLLRK